MELEMEVTLKSLYNYCYYDHNVYHGQSFGNNTGAICGGGKNCQYGVKVQNTLCSTKEKKNSYRKM